MHTPSLLTNLSFSPPFFLSFLSFSFSSSPKGPFTILIEESVAHDGAPFKISLSADGDDAMEKGCVLLDHIPSNPSSKPSYGRESTYTKYYVTVMIPNVKCNRCSLQIANPMTDKIAPGSSCTYPGGGNMCRSVYHSCVDVRITGKTPRAKYACPSKPPPNWIQPAAAVPNVYTQERAAVGDWSEAGWLTTAPPEYRQDCGACSPSQSECKTANPVGGDCLNGQEGVCINDDTHDCSGASTLSGHCPGAAHIKCCPTGVSEPTKPSSPGSTASIKTNTGNNGDGDGDASAGADPCNAIRCSAQCDDECGWSTSLNLCGTGYETSTWEADEKLGNCSDSDRDVANGTDSAAANKGTRRKSTGVVVAILLVVLVGLIGGAVAYCRLRSKPRGGGGGEVGATNGMAYNNPQYDGVRSGSTGGDASLYAAGVDAADATYSDLPPHPPNAEAGENYMEIGQASDA